MKSSAGSGPASLTLAVPDLTPNGSPMALSLWSGTKLAALPCSVAQSHMRSSYVQGNTEWSLEGQQCVCITSCLVSCHGDPPFPEKHLPMAVGLWMCWKSHGVFLLHDICVHSQSSGSISFQFITVQLCLPWWIYPGVCQARIKASALSVKRESEAGLVC